MDFSATEINQVYNLVDKDNKAYRELFQDANYHSMMWSLIRGKGGGGGGGGGGVWKCHPSTSEVTTFQMSALKPVPKI